MQVVPSDSPESNCVAHLYLPSLYPCTARGKQRDDEMTDKTFFEKSHGGNMMLYTAGISPALQASLVPDAEGFLNALALLSL